MDEKLLPPGESAPDTSVPSYFHLENKLNPSSAPAAPAKLSPRISEPISPLPAPADFPKVALPGVPSPAQQQWGAVISIVVIVLMIVIGAFYAWGNRIAEQQALTESANTQ